MSFMTDETRKRIAQVFTEHSGYARTQDIRSSGIHHKYLQQLVEEGSSSRSNTVFTAWRK